MTKAVLLGEKEKKLVRESSGKVLSNSVGVAREFYHCLFDLDPSLEKIFKIESESLEKSLMTSISFVVKNLDTTERILPLLEDLGVKCAKYGVKDHHYDLIGQALLCTLEKGLGDECTPELKKAWHCSYTLIVAATMRDAAARLLEDTGI